MVICPEPSYLSDTVTCGQWVNMQDAFIAAVVINAYIYVDMSH